MIMHKIEIMFNQKSIEVTKVAPNKTTTIDIKPLILNFDIKHINNEICIDLQVLSGSRENLKPNLVINALEKYTDMEIYDYRIHRKRLYLAY